MVSLRVKRAVEPIPVFFEILGLSSGIILIYQIFWLLVNLGLIIVCFCRVVLLLYLILIITILVFVVIYDSLNLLKVLLVALSLTLNLLIYLR